MLASSAPSVSVAPSAVPLGSLACPGTAVRANRGDEGEWSSEDRKGVSLDASSSVGAAKGVDKYS